MSKGEELFAKDNLKLKSLAKLGKEERVSQIEINLQEIADYFYFTFHHKDEREWRQQFADLILSKKLFLDPLKKIAKNPENIPGGFGMILLDCLRTGKKQIEQSIKEIKESNISDDEKASSIDEFNNEFDGIAEKVTNVIEVICEKQIKKLKKLGVAKEYAPALAPLVLDGATVNGSNLFRFVPKITSWIYYNYQASLVIDENKKATTTKMGIDLSNPKVMKRFMGVITKSMDLSTLGEFIKQILLEKREANFDKMTKEQLAVYSAITVYALETLDDPDIFNGKGRVAIIKSYGQQLLRDEKRNRGGKRRISFNELDPDLYPRIVKAFKKINEDN